MKIRKVIQLYHDFGFKVAFACYCSSAFTHPMAITTWREKILINWIRKNYSSVINKYKNLAENDTNESSNIIWSIWWQGEDNAPEVVKICFASVRRHCGTRDFKVITKENYRDYIQLPEYIIQKVDAGMITLTHFSDILRFYLLSRYGGLWLDATILVTQKIPKEIFSKPYFTSKRSPIPNDFNVAQRRWTGFLQAAQRDSILCNFGLDIMLEYWKTHTSLISYVFIDYIIALAYEEFSDFKNILDALPYNNPEIDSLRPLLNSPWDENKFAALTRSTIFFKLNWKQKFFKTISGRETFYGHLFFNKRLRNYEYLNEK